MFYLVGTLLEVLVSGENTLARSPHAAQVGVVMGTPQVPDRGRALSG